MDTREQIELSKRLQWKLLQRFEALLDSGELSPTDAATLSRILHANGWNLDETNLPQGLRSKLTSQIDPKTAFGDDAPDVVGRIA